MTAMQLTNVTFNQSIFVYKCSCQTATILTVIQRMKINAKSNQASSLIKEMHRITLHAHHNAMYYDAKITVDANEG